jgi:mannose-6-phosphate isomerase
MPDRWHESAWRLLPHRVPRFYRGGRLLDAYRAGLGAATPGAEVPDSDRPEDWLGSATRAWTPPGVRLTDEGLASAEVDGEPRRVADVLAGDPGAIAGPGLPDGPTGEPTTGVLVKLLDAGSRLPVHAHPSRAFARRHLGSAWGKAEAWIVLGTRDVAGEPPPHVRLGFSRDVERGELRGWIETGDGAALRDAMNHRETRTGDVWLVPPGTPHAIGAGVFILEVQEPTDFSLVLELGGFPVDPDDAHLGLGWDVALEGIDCTALDVRALEALRGRLDGAAGSSVLPDAADEWFEVHRLRVGSAEPLGLPQRFVVGAVTAGAGQIRTRAGALAIGTGDAFAIPASAVAGATIEATEPLEILAATTGRRPPKPADRRTSDALGKPEPA